MVQLCHYLGADLSVRPIKERQPAIDDGTARLVTQLGRASRRTGVWVQVQELFGRVGLEYRQAVDCLARSL